MGRSKAGRALNPTDAARKKERLREKEKNAAKRRENRTNTFSKKSSDELRAELHQLNQLETSGVTLDSKQLARRKTIQQVMKEQETAAAAAAAQAPVSAPPDAQPHLPSTPFLYYHPVFNPHGAPPPSVAVHSRPRASMEAAHYRPHHQQQPRMTYSGQEKIERKLQWQVAPLISVPLDHIPPPPDNPELSICYTWIGPNRPPGPPATQDGTTAVASFIPTSEQERDAPSEDDALELIAGYMGDESDMSLRDLPAEELHSGSQPAGSQGSLYTATDAIDTAIVALVPASVKRRKVQPQQPPKHKATVALQTNASLSRLSTVNDSNTEEDTNYEQWMRDMEAIGAV